MGTLFECLKEARLEKYYPSFRAQGITKSEALTHLTVHDCPAFGITSAEDKRRLVDLINIVKAVHNAERDNYLARSSVNRSSTQNVRNKVPRKRNRSPAVASAQQVSGRSVSASVGDVHVRDRSQLAGLSGAGAALLDLMSDESSEASSSDSAEHSDYEPAVKHSVTAGVSREIPLRTRKTPVEKVKHGAGYNYGVPGTSQGARPKTRASSARIHDDKIKVCVRKRPISKREVKNGEEDMVKADSTTTLVLSEPKQAVDLTAYTLQHEFIFDEVFEETCTNEDVYIRAARPLINCIFDGGSATCFAYGQTGAGKTHTMIGNAEVPGLYLLAAHDIFSIINSRQYGSGIKVWVSFFEIYCGQLFDLLNKRNRLHAREDGSQRVCIAGLTETEAKDEQNLMQVLEYGNAVRSKGSSGINPDSSRSHAVLQMEIRDAGDKRLGRISFIDLAGSERAADSGEPDKQTRMEGAEINQSLLALKECIRSIDQESRHKPFRQSKLTHILKDSFIGNSRTCMIANISPASGSCEHTLNTLRYADRVKELRKNTSASTSRSMNVAMSNILMNIPASGPSLFQPSNILCSSTPMRQSTKQFTNRNSNAELHLDPSETPIKGHGVRRKTANSGSKTSTPPQSSASRPRTAPSTRASVVRHVAQNVTPNVASNIAPNVPSNSVSARKAHNVSSNSESDQTDTDSCNMTGQQKPLNFNQFQDFSSKPANRGNNIVNKSNISGHNIPVVKSTDTENDFPTTDFNDEEGLNDLNRTGGKNPVTASVPVFSTGVSKQTETQSRNHIQQPDRTQSREPQYQVSSVSASVPVLRKKAYTDGENGLKKSEAVHTPGQSGIKESASSSAVTKHNVSPGSMFKSETSSVKTDDRFRSEESEPRARLHREVSQDTNHVGIPSVFTESIDDDMLFDPPSMDQRLWTPRTPSENSGTQPRIPQNPSLQPEIPAVLPAKSTELTTFSQRSPRWQLNKNTNQYPIPIPAPPQAGFRPEPVKNVPSNPAAQQIDSPNNRQNISNISDKGAQPSSHRIPKQKSTASPYRDPGSGTSNTGLGNVAPDGTRVGKDLKEPLSANWFSTPADHDTHVTRSFATNRKGSSGSLNDQDSINSRGDRYSGHYEGQTKVKQVEDEPRHVGRSTRSGVVLDTAKSFVDQRHKALGRAKIDHNSQNGPSVGGYSSDSDMPSLHAFQSRPRVVHSPVLDNSVSNNSPHSFEHTRQKLVHSPLITRQNSNSPVIKDYPSSSMSTYEPSSNFSQSVSEANGDSISSRKNGRIGAAVKTEKLQTGPTFSPIHPQPVTGGQQFKPSGVVSKDIIHPTPVSRVSGEGSEKQKGTDAEGYTGTEQIDLKTQLISSHEDQLANVTSFCKQEMKLLLGAKAGKTKFEDYMGKVSDVLTQKMAAIQLLQDQIIAYQLSTQDSNSPR